MARNRNFWIRLGERETRLRAEDIAETRIEAPIFVSGLARSGTTILLEVLARHPSVASHRYKDYPFLFTPFLWNRFLSFVPQGRQAAQERSHGDGIAVSPDSPEAFEEVPLDGLLRQPARPPGEQCAGWRDQPP